MPPLTLRRNIAVLALATALTGPWAAGAAHQARPQAANPGLLQQLWTALTGLWGVVALDSGCKMDPNGRCVAGSAISPPEPAITRDDGCKMDPSGLCATGSAISPPAITPDDGCKWDPSGGCLPGS